MTFEPGDVVVVPFPFTDRKSAKRRPALVLSSAAKFDIGHSVLAMITSRDNAPWPLDTAIEDGRVAGLRAPSVVRMKLFTLDNRLILRKAGSLSAIDAKSVATNLKMLFKGFGP